MNTHEQQLFDSHHARYQRLLVLRGYSKATIDNYTRGIRRLAVWCDHCPDQRLNKADFEAYFSQLILERDWEYVEMIKPPTKKHLPDILVAEEINRPLSCVRRLHYQVYLYTVYTLGIRLSEGMFLEVGDIDGKTMRVSFPTHCIEHG